MKNKVIKKAILAITVAFLGSGAFCGSTLAYITAHDEIVNTFVIVQRNNTQYYTLRYNLEYNGNIYTFSGNQFVNPSKAEKVLVADDSPYINTPKGLTVTRVVVNDSTHEPGQTFKLTPNKKQYVDIYFKPMDYTIAYNYSGVENPIISGGELMSTYNVISYIMLPYDNVKQQERNWLITGRPTDKTYSFVISGDAELANWRDQNNTVHSFETDWKVSTAQVGLFNRHEIITDWTCPGANGTSWCQELAPKNGMPLDYFDNRMTGNITLTAEWK